MEDKTQFDLNAYLDTVYAGEISDKRKEMYIRSLDLLVKEVRNEKADKQ